MKAKANRRARSVEERRESTKDRRRMDPTASSINTATTGENQSKEISSSPPKDFGSSPAAGAVSGCFGTRTTTNMDAQRPAQISNNNSVLRILRGLFRSKSDPVVEKEGPGGAGGQVGGSRGIPKSRSDGGVSGGTTPKRRFMRVVRDENAKPPEVIDDNPHTICRYSQQFLQQHYQQQQRQQQQRHAASFPTLPSNISPSTEHNPGSVGYVGGGGSLPYVASGHTILKKWSGEHLVDRVVTDRGSGSELCPPERSSPSCTSKRATFFGEVQVIEYSMKEKTQTPLHCTRIDRLRDHDDENDDGEPMSTDGGGEGHKEEQGGCEGEGGDMTDSHSTAQWLTGGDTRCPVPPVPCAAVTTNEGSMRNIFCALVTLDSDGLNVSRTNQTLEQTTPAIKHIRLADLITASAADNRTAEQSDASAASESSQ